MQLNFDNNLKFRVRATAVLREIGKR